MKTITEKFSSIENILHKIYSMLCIGWIFVQKSTFEGIDLKINNIKIELQSIDPIRSHAKSEYDMMDNIITQICKCTYQQILGIQFNNITFQTFMDIKLTN